MAAPAERVRRRQDRVEIGVDRPGLAAGVGFDAADLGERRIGALEPLDAGRDYVDDALAALEPAGNGDQRGRPDDQPVSLVNSSPRISCTASSSICW